MDVHFCFQPTNFKLFACHQDLCVRNDGRRQAELQSVSFIESIKDTEGVKHRVCAKYLVEIRSK